MRVLVLHEDRRTYGKGGGAETMLRDLTSALRGRGDEVEWYQGDGAIEDAIARFKPDVCQVMTVHNFMGFGPVRWLQRHGYPHAWALMDYWPFCLPRMLLVNKDESCPAVRGVCDHSCKEPRAPAQWLGVVNGSPIIALNPYSADIYRRNGVRVDYVAPLGVDTRYFTPDEARREPGRIVTMSAWANFPTKGMHILRAALDKLGARGHLITGKGRDEVQAELQRGDIFVFPSCYQETWGLSLTEAMACGCAPIASDVAGPRAQIEDGVTGLLVPPREPDALAAAIKRLLDDEEERRRLGNAARAWTEMNASLERMGETYAEVYRSVING